MENNELENVYKMREEADKAARNRANGYYKRRRLRLISEHKCAMCTKKLPADWPYTTCHECMLKNQRYQKLRREKNGEQGLCKRCGKRPSIKGKTLCRECALKNLSWINSKKKKDDIAKCAAAGRLAGLMGNTDACTGCKYLKASNTDTTVPQNGNCFAVKCRCFDTLYVCTAPSVPTRYDAEAKECSEYTAEKDGGLCEQ